MLGDGATAGVRTRDDIVRLVLAFAVVAALGLLGGALGRATVAQQTGGGSSGSSNSGGTTSNGSSSSDRGDGSSSSNGDSGSSSGSGDSSSTEGGGGDDQGAPAPTQQGSADSPATTTPGPTEAPGPTTTIPPTASTLPPDLPDDVAPTEEVDCPRDLGGSGTAEVKCYAVDPDDVPEGGEVGKVAVPGIPVPLVVPAPVPVPVVNDTGDSGSTHNDNRVIVSVDVDEQTVIDGYADEADRIGQRAIATVALLVLVPLWALVVLALRRSRTPPAPPAPPPPGRWVWEPDHPAPPPEPPS